jgi:hypothetical protein
MKEQTIRNKNPFLPVMRTGRFVACRHADGSCHQHIGIQLLVLLLLAA